MVKRTTYQVNGNDSDGCTLVSREAFTLKSAKQEARLIETDGEYLDSGLSRIEIIEDLTGDCVLEFRIAS